MNKSHIFICFSSRDEDVALEVVDFLESHDMKCWISTRDVPPGHNYQETIVQALDHAKGIVFLFSPSSAVSGEIRKELSVAGSMNVPMFPLRLAPITPHGALRYELATRQWIDIFENRDEALRKLAETIDAVVNRAVPDATQSADPAIDRDVSRAHAKVTSVTWPPPANSRSRVRVPIVAPGSQEFEAMRSLLARHIGPIAKIYVQKAATEARTQDDFCERLAAYISMPSDRNAFLQAARTRLGKP